MKRPAALRDASLRAAALRSGKLRPDRLRPDALQFWRGWSIGLRMAFITMLPVTLLFTSFVWYSWYAHRA